MSHSTDSTLTAIYVAACDINGILRGKRIPYNQLDKANEGGVRLPLSILSVDVWGADVIAEALSSGDIDGLAEVTGRGLIPMPHTQKPSALLPVWLANEDETPYLGDPRRLLAQITEQFKKRKLKPVIATELEFYLVDYEQDKAPLPPISPQTGLRLSKTSILGIQDLYEFDGFLDDIYAQCEAVNIPLDAAIAENGCGQFEINLLHTDDPLKAADDAMLFKQIVKAVATKHGWTATFMAKPYGDQSGNGFHVHCSIEDEAGNNIFDDGSNEGSTELKQAVAGVLATMADFMLLFAPNFNSYRRLAPGSHAPTAIAWGYENRTAAVRIPGGSNKARRLEHRVAGADANPYLVCSAVLAGILYGLEQQLSPPPPTQGSSYEQDDLEFLPMDWFNAIDAFEFSDKVPKLFPREIIDLIVAVKHQEASRFAKQITNFEYSSYLQDM